jgi:DNA repair exonuclease SbcCD ATPase subunit
LTDLRYVGPLSAKLKGDAQGLRSHGFDKAAPHIEMRAAEARALEAELVRAGQENNEMQNRLAELEEMNRAASQLWRDAMEREARLREALQKIADDPFLDPEANAAFARDALTEGENDGR